MIYSSEEGLAAVLFPVRRGSVFAETQPGRMVRVDGKRALVNEDSRRVVSVVSARYQVLTNKKALEFARRFCITTFPTTAPAGWYVSEVETPLTRSHCHIDLRYSGDVLTEDWAFGSGKSDLYAPFIRVTNSYNQTRALSIQVGVQRLACTNGMMYGDALTIRVPHHTPEMERKIERLIDEAKFRKLRRELRHRFQRLTEAGIPHSSFLVIIQSVLGLSKPRDLPTDRQQAWDCLESFIDSTATRYVRQLGENGYALVNAITDLATRPPTKVCGYNFIRRERHTLQKRAGTWVAWFGEHCHSREFLERYLRKPSFPQ